MAAEAQWTTILKEKKFTKYMLGETPLKKYNNFQKMATKNIIW